jgi:hypothetical protein
MVKSGAPSKPRLFICSSAEGRDVAEAIQFSLDSDTEVEVWHQNIFKLSDVPLDSLETAVRTNDFAVVVVTADDVTTKRGVKHVVPRDNVIFELGMFVGALGRRRTFVVMPRDEEISLPTDLSGLTVARYAPRSDGNMIAAVGKTCTQIKSAMERASRHEGGVTIRRPTTAERRPLTERRMYQRALGIAHGRDRNNRHRIVDISVSGAFLETESPIRLGAMLDLDLEFDGQATVHVTAEVVRVQEPSWRRPGGVGVKFIKCSRRSKSAIGKYMRTATAARLRAV